MLPLRAISVNYPMRRVEWTDHQKAEATSLRRKQLDGSERRTAPFERHGIHSLENRSEGFAIWWAGPRLMAPDVPHAQTQHASIPSLFSQLLQPSVTVAVVFPSCRTGALVSLCIPSICNFQRSLSPPFRSHDSLQLRMPHSTLRKCLALDLVNSFSRNIMCHRLLCWSCGESRCANHSSAKYELIQFNLSRPLKSCGSCRSGSICQEHYRL